MAIMTRLCQQSFVRIAVLVISCTVLFVPEHSSSPNQSENIGPVVFAASQNGAETGDRSNELDRFISVFREVRNSIFEYASAQGGFEICSHSHDFAFAANASLSGDIVLAAFCATVRIQI